MIGKRMRLAFVASALAIAVTATFLGSRAISAPPAPERVVATLEPFAVAELLAGSSPDVVVVTLDATARHALRGSMPAALFGADDTAFVEHAPRARKVILAGVDPVRVDRVARHLLATGREVAVLAGGIPAWDATMDADPAPPAMAASASAWRTHRTKTALRRSFGDAPPVAATPVVAPALPALAAPGAPKKREGC